MHELLDMGISRIQVRIMLMCLPIWTVLYNVQYN